MVGFTRSRARSHCDTAVLRGRAPSRGGKGRVTGRHNFLIHMRLISSDPTRFLDSNGAKQRCGGAAPWPETDGNSQRGARRAYDDTRAHTPPRHIDSILTFTSPPQPTPSHHHQKWQSQARLCESAQQWRIEVLM